MSTGIAAAGRAWRGADKPVPLPVQALDHATGYFLAAAAVRGLVLRLSEGKATSAGLSLARTAALLMGTPREEIDPKALSPADADYSAAIEATDWGSAHRALPPVRVAGAPIGWMRPASRLGSAPAAWGV
jgi:crotonobetainyl-CoA:carnitine CoA-transferase CaiB-like acyl-CoA transferase